MNSFLSPFCDLLLRLFSFKFIQFLMFSHLNVQMIIMISLLHALKYSCYYTLTGNTKHSVDIYDTLTISQLYCTYIFTHSHWQASMSKIVNQAEIAKIDKTKWVDKQDLSVFAKIIKVAIISLITIWSFQYCKLSSISS